MLRPLVMHRTRGLSGPLFQKCKAGLVKGPGNYWMPGGPGGILPFEVTPGNGWTNQSQNQPGNAYLYQTDTLQFPDLRVEGIQSGETYEISGNLETLTGSAPSIKVRLGYDLTDLDNLTATGEFSYTAVAGAENSWLRFIVDDNTTVTEAKITNLRVRRVS